MTLSSADILDRDERILWQGRPVFRLSLYPDSLPIFIFGLFFFVAAVLMLAGYFETHRPRLQTAYPGLLIGAFFLLAPLARRFWQSRAACYMLTNRRALVVYQRPLGETTIRSHPINANTNLELVHRGRLSALWFFKEATDTNEGLMMKNIGFDEISDANVVYDLLRDIQNGMI